MGARLLENSVLRVHPDVVWRDVDGEVVLLNVVTGHYFGLDDVGSEIWKLAEAELTSGGRIGDLRDRLLEAFDADPAVIDQDLAALLDQLAEQHLITVTPAPAV